MVQMILSNLGIILMVHLLVNTVYNLKSREKISEGIRDLLQITIVIISVIFMFYFPIEHNGVSFDMRVVIIFFISLLKGPTFTIPIVTVTALWRYMIGGPALVGEIIFSLVLPALMPRILQLKDGYNLKPIKVFTSLTTIFLISDISFWLSYTTGASSFQFDFFLIRYTSTLICGVVFYFFIYTGTKTRMLRKKLREYAELDPLTSVYNIRKFNEITEKKIKNITSGEAYIAMLDIDYFKQINDTYGHPVGDHVIKKVSEVLRSYCSDDFILGRYGGDEFIIYFKSETKEAAVKFIDQIIQTLSCVDISPDSISNPIYIQISGGVSKYHPSMDLKKCMASADRYLYKSKQNGRCQISG